MSHMRRRRPTRSEEDFLAMERRKIKDVRLGNRWGVIGQVGCGIQKERFLALLEMKGFRRANTKSGSTEARNSSHASAAFTASIMRDSEGPMCASSGGL